ncbi:Monocarboxylate permease Mch4 [Mycena sanguinolenta]|uniref:Monocarboxylate permease Mch4 n=1 Tax=Mycena sanguinolenta TaxID=230812 RepID=A0A8H6YCN9_9AGAR|nr:Monocarboxylate permease Mch4 [Mycena sanguinolenta]
MAEASTLSIELEQRPTGSRLPSDPPIPLTPPNLQSDMQPELPDGGYGWAVVCGCAVLSFWFLGISYTWGILQAELVKKGSFLSFDSVFRWLLHRCLRSALLGIFLLGVGEILSGFATENIGGLFVTFGAVTGIGTRYVPGIMLLTVSPHCFAPAVCALWLCLLRQLNTSTKDGGLANGIVYASGGFGGAVTSFAMDALLKSVGPAYTFRIIGMGTLVTGLPAAWLIKERTTIRTAGFIEWALFRDPRFIVLFIAGAIGTFPLFVPPFFLPLYSNSGWSLLEHRLGCGFASDLIGPVNVLFVALLLSAVSMLAIWPVSTSLTPLVLFVMINGAANGGFFSTMPTVVGTVFGSARVSVAMGMIVTGWAGGYLMGAPIAGYLLNAYGGTDSTLSAYHPAMFYAGSMGLGATGLVSLVRLQTSTRFFQKV